MLGKVNINKILIVGFKDNQETRKCIHPDKLIIEFVSGSGLKMLFMFLAHKVGKKNVLSLKKGGSLLVCVLLSTFHNFPKNGRPIPDR